MTWNLGDELGVKKIYECQALAKSSAHQNYGYSGHLSRSYGYYVFTLPLLIRVLNTIVSVAQRNFINRDTSLHKHRASKPLWPSNCQFCPSQAYLAERTMTLSTSWSIPRWVSLSYVPRTLTAAFHSKCNLPGRMVIPETPNTVLNGRPSSERYEK